MGNSWTDGCRTERDVPQVVDQLQPVGFGPGFTAFPQQKSHVDEDKSDRGIESVLCDKLAGLVDRLTYQLQRSELLTNGKFQKGFEVKYVTTP